MGNIVMPKQSAELSEMEAVLSVYDKKGTWMSNDDFITELKKKIGSGLERQAYTKKTQIPAYFGFVTWEDLSSPRSDRKITASGIKFYSALVSKDEDVIFEEITNSLKNNTFGRNVCGCNSDSDIEPPQLFVRCALILGYLTRKEYGFILWKLDTSSDSFFDVISSISESRLSSTYSFPVIPNIYTDAKPITALVNWKYLEIDPIKINGSEKIIINPKVLKTHFNELYSLKIYNKTDKLFTIKGDDNGDFPLQKIYFGAPGTGKSHTVNGITESKDPNNWERITFHPEFDYASFVGGYKPITKKVKKIVAGIEESNDEIQYKFVPQAFTNIYVKAWKDESVNTPYFLIIEEINRGNCAEIFGDIFQLLDRNSKYTVTPSKELKKHLENKLGKGHEGIVNGLKLPNNLNILATMNTSDQSLFPMDSAFKRRWDWEYIPINYEENYIDSDGSPKENKSYSYKVVDDATPANKLFDWKTFIKAVNAIIKNNENLGMDKCIGNFFVKPEDDENITLEVFINKVIFYLWNDVFKDEEDLKNIFPKNTFYEDFFPIKDKGLALLEEVVNKANEIAENEKYKDYEKITWNS